MKICSRCKQSLPLSAFGKCSSKKDGLMSYCRACMLDYNRERMKNPEYSKRHTEWTNEYRRKRRAKPGGRDKEYKRERLRYHTDEEVRRRILANSMLQYARRQSAEGDGFSLDEWDALCSHYGNRCLACGANTNLTVDHILPLSKGGKHELSNVQPLCKSCNCRKHDKYIDYRPFETQQPNASGFFHARRFTP